MPTAERFELNGTSDYAGAVGLGASTHYYNDETDIERLADTLRAALPRRHAAARARR